MCMNRFLRNSAWSILMGVVMTMIGANCPAQTNDVADTSPKNIVIESDDGAVWDFNSGVAIFRGNVRVTDAPNMVLTCELLTAHFGINTSTNSSAKTNATAVANTSAGTNTTATVAASSGLGAVDTIEAERNVVIDFASPEGKRHATGDKLVYVAATDIVTLTGNVNLDAPQGRITAPAVTFDRKTGKFNVLGKAKFESSIKVGSQSFFPQITNKSK
jgi:lipopolysaccharide export system protein LptA